MLTLDDGEPPETLCPLSLAPILDRGSRSIPVSTWWLICVIVLELGEQQAELVPFRVSEHVPSRTASWCAGSRSLRSATPPHAATAAAMRPPA
jgi:hypothetical protein